MPLLFPKNTMSSPASSPGFRSLHLKKKVIIHCTPRSNDSATRHGTPSTHAGPPLISYSLVFTIPADFSCSFSNIAFRRGHNLTSWPSCTETIDDINPPFPSQKPVSGSVYFKFAPQMTLAAMLKWRCAPICSCEQSRQRGSASPFCW